MPRHASLGVMAAGLLLFGLSLASLQLSLYSGSTIIAKPVIKPPFSEAAQERDLRRDLPLVPWSHKRWNRHWLPQACVAEAQYAGHNPADFEAVEVWYDDCAASWTVCRHRRADESWFYILDVSIPSNSIRSDPKGNH